MEDTENPILPFLENQGVLILDGGLATELEARGFSLDDPLWSARLLFENPEAIRRVHRDYLEAGADCISSASYQGSLPGFMARGFSESQAESLLCRSVDLAIAARDAFWSEERNRAGRLRPLIAASVGPYGAFRADGSEFTGDYGLSREELARFHRRRLEILAGTPADLLACETIPSYEEAAALAELLTDTPSARAWVSFSARDELRVSDGTPLADCARLVDPLPQVIALGVNCTAPRYVPGLVASLREVTGKPILVYPNSGEVWDAASRRWTGESDPVELAAASRQWNEGGARLIGGCCRTRPEHIRRMRRVLLTRAGA